MTKIMPHVRHCCKTYPDVNEPYAHCRRASDERLIFYNITRCYGKRVTVFTVAIAAGDIIKYQWFVYGSFVWEIHVRYNKDKYQSPLILTEFSQHDLINVSYLGACYLYQVMMTLHFLTDVANDAESTQK